MGVLEDIRQAVQDFIAPEIRSIGVRLDALEKRFDKQEVKIDTVMLRLESLTNTVTANHSAVMVALDIDRRMLRLEAAAAKQEEKHV